MEVGSRLLGSLGSEAAEDGGGSPPVVAVACRKGWEQVTAVVGVLSAHCAYLPISASQLPRQRIEQVLSLSGAVAVVSDGPSINAAGWLCSCGLPVVDVTAAAAAVQPGVCGAADLSRLGGRRVGPRSLAYLI